MFKASIYVFLLIFLGKLFALLKDVALSLFYGISWEADAFFIANGVPVLMFSAFYTSISLVFIPVFISIKNKHGINAAYFFSNSFINVYLIIACILSCLAIYFSSNIIDLISPGISSETRELSIDLAQIFSTSFLFTAVVSVLISMQHANKVFIGSQLVPVINNLFVIAAIIFLSKNLGLEIVAIVAVLAWVVQIPIQKHFVGLGFTYKPCFVFESVNFRYFLLLFVPAFLGTLLDQANILVDIYLASSLEAGTVSAINYASRLMMAISLLFPMVVSTIMYPYFSDYVAQNKIQKLNISIEKSLKISLLLSTPLLIIVLLFSEELVKFVFERGSFDSEAAFLTGNIFFMYSFAIIFLAIRELLKKVYYAMHKPKIVLYINGFSILLNIALSFILVEVLGAKGIALATSISVLVHVTIQFYVLKRIIGSRFFRKMNKFFIKLSFSSAIMLIVLIMFKNFRVINIPLLDIGLTLFVAVLSYIVSLSFLKQRETVYVREVLFQRLLSVWKQ